METLGFAGKMRKRHAETTRPSGKYGLKAHFKNAHRQRFLPGW